MELACPSHPLSLLTGRPGYHKFSGWSLFRGFINMQQGKMELQNFQLPWATERREPVFLALKGPGTPSAIPRKVGCLRHPLSAKSPREVAASIPPSNLSLERLHTLCAQESRALFEPCFTSRSNGKNSMPHLFSFFSLLWNLIIFLNFSHTAWFPFLNGVKFMCMIRELAWEKHLSFKSYMF